MFVKCMDMNGFVNEEQPANFLLEYDPTSPIIQEAYAVPDPVIQGGTVQLVIKTDDKSICKFSNSTTDYSFMNGKFEGWEEFGKLLFRDGVEPEFKYTNTITLTLPATTELTQYSYNVACQNRAGNISDTSQLNFIVDYSVSGYIISTSPSGSLRQTSVTLEVNTSKDANCEFIDQDGLTYSFTQTGATQHTAQRSSLTEKAYTYPVTCNFFSPDVTRSTSINFIIDFSAPIITNVDDGNISCSDEKTLQITANDTSSVYFNYSMYDKLNNSQLIDWTYTTSSTPEVDLEDLITYGRSYYFKVIPIDAASNIGTQKQSNGFIARDPDSEECRRDTTPPEVTIKEEPRTNGIRITMTCADNYECDDLFYNKVPPEQNCNATQTYNNPFTLTETTRICWKATDTAGSKHKQFRLACMAKQSRTGSSNFRLQ